MNFLPGTKLAEKQLNTPLIFTIIILYQGLIAGTGFTTPVFIKKKMENPYFRLFSLFFIALSATKDIETAMIGLLIFISTLFVLRTKEEKEKLGSVFGITGLI